MGGFIAVSSTVRLLEVIDALVEARLRFLIIGGHAVRHFGVDRNTLDFDFHVSLECAQDLEERLRKTKLFSGTEFSEGMSWRRTDFRRFQIGVLPNGKEEWLEFWFRNHLLAPFEELDARHEEVIENGRRLHYLSLPDLIRSKETERDDDWADVRLLEETLDDRNLASARDEASIVQALSQLRTRRGFERAETAGLFGNGPAVGAAMGLARRAVTLAYLLPFAPKVSIGSRPAPLEEAVESALRRLQPGSARHLAVVEAVRLAYQRAAKAADRADKESRQRET